MTTFQQRLRDEMVRRNYSPTTIRTYLHALRTCEQYHRRRRIDRLGSDALRRYQAHLFTEKKLAVGTVGLHVAALRFFYVRVLKRRELKEDLPTPKPHRRLPTVLSPDEVRRLFVRHILPRGFVRIRQAGFLANTRRGARVAVARTVLATPSPSAPDTTAPTTTNAPARATWACPRCGAAMIVGPILSALHLATLTWSFDSS